MKKNRKIILVENAAIAAEGIKAILATIPYFEVVDIEENMEWIFERITVFKPDILIINPSMIDFSQRMRVKTLFQNFPQLILIALIHQRQEQQALKQYDAYIELEDDRRKIEQKLKNLTGKEENIIVNQDSYELTDREIDVLIALAKGLMNKEIADQLHISIHTVISHRKNIIKKTGIKSVAGLTVYALLRNLIDESEIYHSS